MDDGRAPGRERALLLGAAVAKHGGAVVKGLGDGILAAFGSTAEAVNAAHEIQRGIDRAWMQRDADRLAVAAGHFNRRGLDQLVQRGLRQRDGRRRAT